MFSTKSIISTLTALATLHITLTSASPAPSPRLPASATGHKRDATDGAPTDTQILQYATVLEDLEAEFYRLYLSEYQAEDFKAAGYPAWVHDRLEQVASHEAGHSSFLRAALGSAAPPTCKYTFPVTSVDTFLALASVIESVGVSAYLGAAADITTPAYVTVAGSILTVEARHQGWLNAAVLKESAWSGPYDTPLGFSPVFSIASAFINGCDQALDLPFKAFPALTIDMASGALTYSSPSDSNYVVLYSGLTAATFPISGGKVQLPSNLQGFSYALVVSTANVTAVDDSNTVAGPYIIDLPFSSKASNPAAAF